MPKSKRDRKVSLTRVQKKTQERKQNLVSGIRDCCDKFAHVWVVTFNNVRTKSVKEFRMQWQDNCRLFMGKNKVMQIALGTTPETSYRDNLYRLSNRLSGQIGLLFSNVPKSELDKILSKIHEPEYAKAGSIAPQTVSLVAGLLPVQFTMETTLRKLGLPVRLKEGEVLLERDYTVCKENAVLTPDQARILKHLDMKLAEFKMDLVCHWHDNKYEEFIAAGDMPTNAAAVAATNDDMDNNDDDDDDN